MPDTPKVDLGATFGGRTGSADLLASLAIAEQRPSYESGAGALPTGFSTVRQLGTGGGSSGGRCYLMRHEEGGEMRVHKRIPVSHLSAADQEVAEREVNILAAFSHPHIIRYDEAFVRQGQLCIVMEHASGGDLAHHAAELRERGRRVSTEDSLDWFVQLALALRYVHSAKVRAPSALARVLMLPYPDSARVAPCAAGAAPRHRTQERLPRGRRLRQVGRLRRGARAALGGRRTSHPAC